MSLLRPLLACLAFAPALAQETPAPVPPAPPAAPAPAPFVEEVLQPPEPGRFKSLFQPFRTTSAALSPDGKFLAYSIREEDSLFVVVVDIDQPGVAKAKVKVIDDRAATPMMDPDQKERTPGAIRWMRWVTPTRLAVETNQVFARTDAQSNWQSWRGAVLAFNADGSEARTIADPSDLVEFAQDAGSPFSTARDQGGRFIGALPSDSPAEGGADGGPPGTDLLAEDQAQNGSAAPVSLGATSPRTFQVFDFDPDHPDAVTLLSFGAPRDGGNRWIGFHSLNVQTGKLTDLSDELVPAHRSVLVDRQGHPRVTVPETLLNKFPFRYEYLGPKGRNRAQPLEEATSLSGFSISPENYFGERSIPLGFDQKGELLYYASNVGRDTYGVYSIDLATKARGKLAVESPVYDLIGSPATGFPGQDSLVFDRHTHELAGIRYERALRTTAWLRADLQAVQTGLEKLLPGRCVEILDWDATGNRFVASTEGPADPGAYYVFDRTQNRLSEFVRRAPWVDEQRTHLTLPFSFPGPDGALLSGLITAPKKPRMKPIPMVVVCPDFPWQRVHADFATEVQALADMGFVVVQLNGRGAWGFGRNQRESLTNGYDLVQVADISAAIAGLEKMFNVNPRRVALMGRGYGGFIALRALQTNPDRFRCAVAIEAIVDPGQWLEQQRWSDDDAQPHLTRAWFGNEARLKAAPLTSDPGALNKPALLLSYPGADGATRRSSYLSARSFVAAVRRKDGPAVIENLSTDYMRSLPGARAEVFDRIEAFLNEHIYDYKVKMGDLKILPDKTTK